jgi:hypothetical protein
LESLVRIFERRRLLCDIFGFGTRSFGFGMENALPGFEERGVFAMFVPVPLKELCFGSALRAESPTL